MSNREQRRKLERTKNIVISRVGSLELDPAKKYLFIFDPRYITKEDIAIFGREMVEIGITNAVVLLVDGRGFRVLEHNGEFTLEKVNDGKPKTNKV